jgi:hypothetical protein
MDTDLVAPSLGELPVEIRVELVHRLDAVHGRPEEGTRIDAGTRPRRLMTVTMVVTMVVTVIAHQSVAVFIVVRISHTFAHPITPRAR